MRPRENTKKSVSPAILRQISKQIRRMSDAEVFALTFSADRATRRIADGIAHERAEEFAFAAEGL